MHSSFSLLPVQMLTDPGGQFVQVPTALLPILTVVVKDRIAEIEIHRLDVRGLADLTFEYFVDPCRQVLGQPAAADRRAEITPRLVFLQAFAEDLHALTGVHMALAPKSGTASFGSLPAPHVRP